MPGECCRQNMLITLTYLFKPLSLCCFKETATYSSQSAADCRQGCAVHRSQVSRRAINLILALLSQIKLQLDLQSASEEL